MKNCLTENGSKEELALNRLAREQLKLKLLQDIAIDVTICKLHNWDYKEYLRDLKEIICNFLKE